MTNLLFDLDGTLVDSSPGVLNAFRHAFSELDIPCPDKKELMTLIGPPLTVTFEKMFDTPDEVDRAIKVFRQFYNSQGVHQASVYTDVQETLAELQAAGHKLFVTTSKNQPMADLMIDEQGLSTYFTAVYGATETRHHKADVIQACLQDHQLDPEDTFIIGDTRFDMVGGRETGIKGIFADWGYGQVTDLQGCHPHAIIKKPYQLLHLFH